MFATFLRWIAVVLAFPIGLFGLFNFLGAGVDGPHHSVTMHFVGLSLVFFAVASVIPHRILLQTPARTVICFGVLSAPLAIQIVSFAYFCVAAPAFSEIMEPEGWISLAAFIGVSLPAPASFALAWKRGGAPAVYQN